MKQKKAKKIKDITPEAPKWGICFDEKLALLDKLTVEQLIMELDKREITINRQEVLETYEKLHHLQKLYDYYDDKFYLQQEAISQRNQLFDDDFLMFTIEKNNQRKI